MIETRRFFVLHYIATGIPISAVNSSTPMMIAPVDPPIILPVPVPVPVLLSAGTALGTAVINKQKY